MSRNYLIAGNWKMNLSPDESEKLILDIIDGCAEVSNESVDILVCPPFIHIPDVATLAAETEIFIGAQNVHSMPNGAYTGEISAQMLAEWGVNFCIVGHSERRQFCGETDETVASQALTTLDSGLMPIVCVGESAEEEAAGKTLAIIDRQLAPVLLALAGVADEGASVVVAYEPVWAIGTGKTPTPEGVQAVHAHIRQALLQAGLVQTRILYGGSVKASNAETLFALPDVDGGLIGGAALNAVEFSTICTAAANRLV